MRLFTAVCFGRDLQDRLSETAARLRAQSVRGRFTPRDNFHLTLVFLGETPADRLHAVREAMDAVQAAPFLLRLEGAGRFGGGRGALYWVCAQSQPALNRLYEALRRSLDAAGFPVEQRPLKPHITLGREVETLPSFSLPAFSASVPALCAEVRSFTLMQSERKEGKMVYTPLYTRRLTAGDRQE